MKNNSIAKRMRIISGMMLGMIAFLIAMPFSGVGATSLLVGFTAMPFLPMPTMSFGTTGVGPDPEKEALEKIKGMIEVSTKELKDKVTTFEKNQVDEKANLKTITDKMAGLEGKYKEVKDVEEFKTLAKEFSDLSIEFKSAKAQMEKGAGAEKFGDVVEKSLETQKDEIKSIITKGGRVKLVLKAAGPVTSSNFGAGVLQGLRLPGVDPLDRNEQTILPEITVINGGPGSDPFSWVEKVIGEGGAAGVNESADKPLYDWDYVEGKVTAEMTSAIVVVTKQALLRMPMLMSHINDELIAELKETLQTQIITGNGVSPNLNGIKLNATAFNPPIQQTTVNANNYDVIAAISSQVVLAHGIPKVLGVNPAMFYSLQTTKDANNQYLLPPFMSGMPQSPAGALVIAGMRIIPMWDLGADEFLGGDLRRYMFNIVEDINIEIGYFDAIWRKNQLAVRAEIFGNGGVKAQHKNKIIKGNFTYAKALLDGAVSS